MHVYLVTCSLILLCVTYCTCVLYVVLLCPVHTGSNLSRRFYSESGNYCALGTRSTKARSKISRPPSSHGHPLPLPLPPSPCFPTLQNGQSTSQPKDRPSASAATERSTQPASQPALPFGAFSSLFQYVPIQNRPRPSAETLFSSEAIIL